jgi:hypothetical protein
LGTNPGGKKMKNKHEKSRQALEEERLKNELLDEKLAFEAWLESYEEANASGGERT